MVSIAIRKALSKKLPVLFTHIGWAERYDGTEEISGGFAWIRDNPTNNWERRAFQKRKDGYFYCGIGSGRVKLTAQQQLHVVFIARDPEDRRLKVVGLYAAASIDSREQNWVRICTKTAVPWIGERPSVDCWPDGRSVRRWAYRDGRLGREHLSLYELFQQLSKHLIEGRNLTPPSFAVEVNDPELEGFEGKERQYFKKHRHREARLRSKKIEEVKRLHNGRLICEVPRCGFDFLEKYGELGRGYAQVHHIRPLREAPKKGQTTKLEDLAIVCANCHAIIHRNGKCLPLNDVIP